MSDKGTFRLKLFPDLTDFKDPVRTVQNATGCEKYGDAMQNSVKLLGWNHVFRCFLEVDMETESMKKSTNLNF